jgi:hypothetical protein
MSEAITHVWIVYSDEGNSAVAEERVWSVHRSETGAVEEAVVVDRQAAYGSRVECVGLWP